MKATKTKHAPGPWEKGAHNLSIISQDGSVIAHAGVSTTLEVPVQHANARLIAAAPELLEACKQLCDATEDQRKWAISHACAVIAKAEGA